jgi:hypothetical protein
MVGGLYFQRFWESERNEKEIPEKKESSRGFEEWFMKK